MSDGPSLGEIAFNSAQTGSHSTGHAPSTGHAMTTADETGLKHILPENAIGAEAYHSSTAMQPIVGETIRLPIGEGQGALSDTEISLGSHEIPLATTTPLGDVKYTGDTTLATGVSPESNLNAMNPPGIDAVDKISSAAHGGGGH